jgi:general secretion pathway protein G
MKSKKGFTLIELLVVIAIIGILTTVAVVALNNARAKARDAKRVADVKQVQTALELFFNDQGRYPTAAEFISGSIYSTSSNGTTTYMAAIPTASDPADGSCTNDQNQFAYADTATGYILTFCTGGTTGSLTAGLKCATPSGVLEGACPPSTCVAGDMALPCPSGLTTADAGCYCGGGLLFYVDSSTYYISAPAKWNNGADPTAEWGCSGTDILGADGTAVGSGSQNTVDIVAGCSTAGIAAEICSSLSFNGYSDWFLPSVNEAYYMYTNLKANGLGGIANATYWTSSEQPAYANSPYAYWCDFNSGTFDWGWTARTALRGVRPIRSAVY